MKSSTAAALALVVLSAGAPTRARANGALPATIQVLLPPGAPDTIVVATNFGVITSTDAGQRWRWICEHGLGSQGKAYQLTAAPEGASSAWPTWAWWRAPTTAAGGRWCSIKRPSSRSTTSPIRRTAGRVLALGISRQLQRTYQLAEVRLAPPAPPRILYTAPAGRSSRPSRWRAPTGGSSTRR